MQIIWHQDQDTILYDNDRLFTSDEHEMSSDEILQQCLETHSSVYVL